MIYEIIWTDVVEETTPPHYQHFCHFCSLFTGVALEAAEFPQDSKLKDYVQLEGWSVVPAYFGWLVAGPRLGFIIGIMQSYEFQNHGWWPIRVYTSHFCRGSLRHLCSLVLKPERHRFAADWVCAILETFRWSISMLNSDPLPGRMFPKLPIISKSDSSDLPAVLWQRWIRLDVHGTQRLYT